MNPHTAPCRPAPALRLLVAAAVLGAATGAHAVVSAPALTTGISGEHFDLSYGPTGAGNVYSLRPFLFVQGLGSADTPDSVVALNPGLSYSYGIEPGTAGSNLLISTYRITNVSASSTFNLRFAAVANPDGDSTNYLDVISESWGAAAATDPAARAVQEFTDNPLSGIVADLKFTNSIVNGGPVPPGACATNGCDALLALQWGAPLISIAPGETFVARIGLSDAGLALSSRFLTAASVFNPGTTLTFSGTGEVVAVPEVSSWAMLITGLGLVGALARRRRG